MVNLTPKPKYPTYPPYHSGLYLEDYFMDYVDRQELPLSRQYIKVGWTSYYNNGENRNNLKEYLSNLSFDKKYFTVCQHDDAPQERLPDDTLVFCAGGNYNGPNKIPIPLICSKISIKPSKEKNILCSFVGSVTHPIRERLLYQYCNDPEFFLYASNWSPTISSNQIDIFLDATSKSKFVLCPRGYGNTSFRLYEVMQMGAIPVYVSDEHALPWSDELDWNNFSILIKPNEIPEIKNILKNISDDHYQNMVNFISKKYDEYFSLEGMCNQIIKRIK